MNKKLNHIKLFENYVNYIELNINYLTKNKTEIDLNFLDKIAQSYISNENIKKYLYDKKIKGSKSMSEYFENKFNLKGLTGDWVYPFNSDRHKNEYLIFMIKLFDDKNIFENLINELYDIYVNLNPKLKNIKVNTTWDKYLIMMGITSNYNLDDINDFIHIGGYQDRLNNDPNYKNILLEIKDFFGESLQYVPSIKTLKNIKHQLNLEESINVNEGLIKSYDADLVIKHLIQHEGLSPNDVWISDGESGSYKLKIDFNYKNIRKAKSITQMLKNVYGWFLTWIDDGPGSDIDSSYLNGIFEEPGFSEVVNDIEEDEDEIGYIFVYERKFDIKNTENIDTLYHITDRKFLPKIQKIGLVPKSGNKKTLHPERIYFTVDKKSLKNLANVETSDYLDYIDDEVILKISTKDLNIPLYVDPNAIGSVYTTTNIPPKNIKIENESY